MENTITSLSVGASSGNTDVPQNVQLMFAMLQLELAESAKQSALDKMDEIQAVQDQQKELTKYLNEMRGLLSDAKDNTFKRTLKRGDQEIKNTTDWVDLNDWELIGYLEGHGYISENDFYYNKDSPSDNKYLTTDQLETIISQMESDLECLGSDTQQQMIYVQDFMGQYNAYLQGCNSQINANNQTLMALARGQ